MKFTVKRPLKLNIYSSMRGLGYHFLGKDEKTGEMSYVHGLSGDSYPRLHLFIKADGENLILSLHLDQKKPSYGSSPAHSGEYGGELVAKEAERIKKILKQDGPLS